MGGIFALFIILPILFIGGIVVLIIFVVRKSTKTHSPTEVLDNHQEMLGRVYQKKPSLIPWQHTSLDIVASMQFSYRKGFAHSLRGFLMDDNHDKIIAFDRYERGMRANGYFFAASSHFDLYVEIEDEKYTFRYNKQFLGTIAPNGTIFDAQNRQIGFAKHPSKNSFSIGSVEWRSGSNTYPLHLYGRHLATLNVCPELSASNAAISFNENMWGSSIVMLHQQPTVHEEVWLLALATTEVVYHGKWLM